jgi:hypothetical protein
VIRVTRRRGFIRLLGLVPSAAVERVIRVTRRRRRGVVIVVIFAKKVFTDGIGSCSKSEGQLKARHFARGKRALLGVKH